jgi:hypothetical protein
VAENAQGALVAAGLAAAAGTVNPEFIVGSYVSGVLMSQD